MLDPELAAPTGPELTATSGATALARAVEALYSADRQPLADAYALQALRLLVEPLPRAIADGADLEARSSTLVGSLISGIAAQNAMVSVVHAVGHAVGGRYALQHGIAHAILLPRAAARCLPGDRRAAVRPARGARRGGPAARRPTRPARSRSGCSPPWSAGCRSRGGSATPAFPRATSRRSRRSSRASRCCEPAPVELGEPDLLELLVDAW